MIPSFAVERAQDIIYCIGKYQKQGLIPKIPVDLGSSVRPAFILSGIMYLEDKPQAIINGHVLEEGDKISGATVLVIEKDCVLLDLNDTNIKVELSK